MIMDQLVQFLAAAFAPWFAVMVILIIMVNNDKASDWLGPGCDCDAHVRMYRDAGKPWTPRRGAAA